MEEGEPSERGDDPGEHIRWGTSSIAWDIRGEDCIWLVAVVASRADPCACAEKVAMLAMTAMGVKIRAPAPETMRPGELELKLTILIMI